MKIDRIHLKNYRRYADFSVEFTSRFSLLVGPNGSGKTSLLNATAMALAGWMYQIQSHVIAVLDKQKDVRLLVAEIDGRFRFEPQYPVEIAAEGTVVDKPFKWTFSRHSQMSRRADYQTEYEPPKIQAVREGMHDVVFPVIAFYRASRHWASAPITDIQAATSRNARLDAYANWFDASADSAALQTWSIAKCLERFQAASEKNQNFDSIHDDELALVNGAIASAVENGKGLRYDLKQKSLLIEWRGREPTPFENLSDGQQTVIAMVADIARRMCLLNPQLGPDVIRKTPGVVIIDELDMHLHPSWQRTVARSLKTAFPAVQFIAASHSPQILGELAPEEIILLGRQGTSQPQVSYGLDSSRVLEEIMGASQRTEAIEHRLAALFKEIEAGNFDAARTLLAGLKADAPDLPEYARAEALLKRKEILGR